MKDGETQTLEIYAEVQEVYVCLNRYHLNFSELYLGEKYSIDQKNEQNIVLINRGNIPTTFSWVKNNS